MCQTMQDVSELQDLVSHLYRHDMEPLHHRYARGDLRKQNLDLHAQHFLFFPFFRLCVFDQDISAFEKLLNCIRQEGKSFLRGRLPLRVKLESAGPQTKT
ncbi:hypothetical protein ABVT39_011783 [Epinephelus coioides]